MTGRWTSGFAWRCAVLLVLVAAATAATATPVPGASSTAIVTATIPSATSLGLIGGCIAGAGEVLDMGPVAVGTTATSPDCSISFGSSNSSSSLRVRQADGRGTAMWSPGNGAIDPAFNGGSTLSTALSPVRDDVLGVAVQPDGKTLVLAAVDVPSSNTDLALLRYTEAGALDPTFAASGIYGWGDPVDEAQWGGIVLMPDGSVLVAYRQYSGTAMQLLRVTAAGAPDTTFGAGGRRSVDCAPGLGEGASTALGLSDGSILLGGWAGTPPNEALLLCKLTPSLAVDTTFGTAGSTQLELSAGAEWVTDLAVDSANRIYASGATNWAEGVSGDALIARFTASGALDTTFNTTGYRTESFSATGEELAHSLVVQADGRPAMTVWAGSAPAWRVVRFTTGGGRDATFGAGGVAAVSRGSDDGARELVLLPDGRFVAGGWHHDGVSWRTALLRLGRTGVPDPSFGNNGLVAFGAPNAWGVGGLAVGTDGALVVASVDNQDVSLTRLRSTPVADYADGTADWETPGVGAFGACLRSADPGLTSGWLVGGACPLTDGAHWNDIPTTADVVASAPSPGTYAATLRFGFRATAAQPPGAYLAPVAVEVLAP